MWGPSVQQDPMKRLMKARMYIIVIKSSKFNGPVESVMKSKVLFLSFLFSFISIVSCSSFFNPDSSQRRGPDPLQPIIQANIPCSADSDCVLVSQDCCSCNNGGESIAIHKSQESDYNDKLREMCSTEPRQLCKTVYICERFHAECRNSQCFTRVTDY